MSAEHRLTEAGGLTAAIFGKHPGHGDFLSFGLPDGFCRQLSDWLGSSLGPVRDQLGPAWEAVCHSRTALRFWIGAGIGQGKAWRGVMRMSADKVGRHYPLLALASAAPDSLPVLLTDQTFYDLAQEALGDLLDQPNLAPPENAAALSQRLADTPGSDSGAVGHDHMFWATRATGAAGDLLAELALTDLICGAAARSYWWFSHENAGGAGVLACQGLPDPQALGWLISGGSGAET